MSQLHTSLGTFVPLCPLGFITAFGGFCPTSAMELVRFMQHPIKTRFRGGIYPFRRLALGTICDGAEL